MDKKNNIETASEHKAKRQKYIGQGLVALGLVLLGGGALVDAVLLFWIGMVLFGVGVAFYAKAEPPYAGPPRLSRMAILSFMCAVVAVLLAGRRELLDRFPPEDFLRALGYILGYAASESAMVLGFMAESRIYSSQGQLKGRWLAWLAIVLGFIGFGGMLHI